MLICYYVHIFHVNNRRLNIQNKNFGNNYVNYFMYEISFLEITWRLHNQLIDQIYINFWLYSEVISYLIKHYIIVKPLHQLISLWCILSFFLGDDV